MKTLIAFVIIGCSVAIAQDVPQPVVYEGYEAISDPGIKGGWHKWKTKGFAVVSFNEQQGDFLVKNVRDIKRWIYTRWGLPDIEFPVETRIFCVPDRDIMRKLFNGQDETRVEIRRNQGKVEICVAWLLLNDSPAKTLPVPLTEICLAELSEAYGFQMNYSLVRGMSKLNLPVPVIREELTNLMQQLKSNPSVYMSEVLLTLKQSQWDKLKTEDKKLFDRESMVLCLLLRKEFGESKLLSFLQASDAQAGLSAVYGFRNYAQFDASFGRYMRDLLRDIQSGKTPDSYLEIKAKR